MARAPQVAGPFLPGGGGEEDRAPRAHRAGVERRGDRQHGRHPARVVADAGAADDAAGALHLVRHRGVEDGVQVRANHHRGAPLGAPPLGDHVPRLVDARFQLQGAQLALHHGGAPPLGAGGGGDLGEGDLQGDGRLVAGHQVAPRLEEGVMDPADGAGSGGHAFYMGRRAAGAQPRRGRNGAGGAAASGHGSDGVRSQGGRPHVH
ncbi:MAG: hypothetical protein ABS52_18485 [Gemmatimonadetes bacterium SCN 70-22]|nr:MAG: hypothetical protein ABS52_18485 [Gemmatimonadetes bacterium SCN 70-22]